MHDSIKVSDVRVGSMVTRPATEGVQKNGHKIPPCPAVRLRVYTAGRHFEDRTKMAVTGVSNGRRVAFIANVNDVWAR